MNWSSLILFNFENMMSFHYDSKMVILIDNVIITWNFVPYKMFQNLYFLCLIIPPQATVSLILESSTENYHLNTNENCDLYTIKITTIFGRA